MIRSKRLAVVVTSLLVLNGVSQAQQCQSVLVLFTGSPLAEYGQDLLSQRLIEGGARLVYAERAEEIVDQYVVQFREVITNTRSGKMSFSYEFRGHGFNEKELVSSYSGIVASSEKVDVGKARATYSAANLSAREYAEFQRQTGFLELEYAEQAEYENWFNQLMTDREQRSFWETLRKWNADIIILGVIDVIPVGTYGGIYSSRAVVSVRVLNTTFDIPRVLKAFAVVTNGIDLSFSAANQRVVEAAVERVASMLSEVVPCYKYRAQPGLKAPLGTVGFAVVGIKSAWAAKEFADPVMRILEANLVKYPEIAVFTRKDLEAVLTEQKLGLSGLVENPVELGRLAGARYLLLGEITEFDCNDEQYYINLPILNYLRLTVRNMRAGLFIEVVDTQSGRIIWSTEKSKTGFGFSILGLEFGMSPLNLFREMADEAVEEFYKSFIKSGR
jgi:curli biogenesis system outer membrane secretion channel CsgG